MSIDANDSEIRVIIRSQANERNTEGRHVYIERDVMGYMPLQIYYTSISNGYVGDVPYLNGLMDYIESEELKRDPSIKLDVVKRKCMQSDISKECSVCLEKIKDGDILCTIDCVHTFHYSCITEWGKYKQECPLCRTPIPILEV